MPYLLHTSILLTACFAFYWLLLRRETFFKLNRWVLISSILISIGLPFISIPESWSLKQQEPIVELIKTAVPTITEVAETPLAIEKNNTISTGQDTAPNDIQPTKIQETTNLSTLDFNQVLRYLYFIGLGVFALTFLVQLLLLIAKITSLNSMKDGKYRIVELVKDEAPYSFFNAIFVNPAKYDPDTFEQIIDHEKIHIRQVHFFDKMIAEIVLIVFWFNPIVWLYRRAITNNLEYLTDHSMLRQGTEKQRYQLSLLQVSVPQHPLNLTTNYNQSFLKDRITMMNTKKSSARSFWKYLFILPLFGLSMMSMNNVVSNEKNETFTQEKTTQNIDNERISNTTITDTIPNEPERKYYVDENGEEHSKTEEHEYNQEDESHFYVNGDGEELVYDSESGGTIRKQDLKNGLKRETKSKLNKHTEVTTDGTGKVITEIRYYSGDTNTRPGTWQGEIAGNQVCFQINNSRPAQHSMWISSECFDKSELSNIPIGARSSFTVKRDAGILTFEGEFGQDNFGEGKFKFAGSAAFAKYLKSEGVDIKDENDRDLLHFFFADINKNYVKELRTKRFDISGGFLRDLAIHDVSMDYIKSLDKLGFEIESTRELIEAKIHGISPEYAEELSKLGFDNLSLDEIKHAKIHGVTAKFAADMRAAGFPNLSLEDLKHGAIHGVSPEYVQSLSSVGFDNLQYEDIINAKIHGVSTDYVREVRAMGYKDAELDEIQGLKIHGVSESYLKSIRAAGFPDVNLEDIKGLKIHGVSPNYINKMKRMGFRNLDLDDIKGAKIHGVSPEYIDSLRDLGFDNDRLQDYVNARIHGLTPRYVERARDGGYNLQKMEDYINIKIRGVRL